MSFFQNPKLPVRVQLRSPAGRFVSKELARERAVLLSRQMEAKDGPRCKTCGLKKSWPGHCAIVLEFDHHFVPIRIAS